MYFDPVATGKRVKELRESRGYTQIQFSEKMNISRGYYSKVELGIKAPSIDVLIDIAEFFGVTLDYLVLGKTLEMDKVKNEIRALIDSLRVLEQTI